MTTTYQVRGGGKILRGVEIREYGSASVLIDRAAGRIDASWDDSSDRKHRRSLRRMMRHVGKLPGIRLGAVELIEGNCCVVVGRFEVGG